ncbi:hypothetical protein [Candidatus Chloroploca asiatica]|uniref:Uncharacterized protein n=1 Tax=Candidatus Chloroploca asiatica TaxID=1506545 RepID=A0A2H3KNH8_9CHLR|nr:hypothetical protein [Candidatus Chloroploca asiatica]PDV99672.1 hypothetical protein A9Q02_00150 [Candidatus Chloroploca asiatica]
MLTDKQLEARRNLQRWLPWMGLILLVVGLYVSAFLIPDLVETAAGPQQLTLDEAANVASATRTYARIEEGAWDCETLQQVQGLSATSIRYGFGPLNEREETKYTEVFFTDNARDVVVFVTLSGDVQCDDLTRQWPTGYLYMMNDGTRQALTNEARLARYFTTDTFLEFCGYCGRQNSLIGAGFGVVFTVAGMAMLFVWWRWRQQG